MKFSLKTLLWGTLLLALGMVSSLLLSPQPVDVQAARVIVGPLRVTVQEDGKTRIREKYTLSAPVSGRLARIELNEGDHVTEQTLLAVILPSDPAILDKRARAEANARVEASEAAALRAESRARQAQINLDLSEVKFERANRLRPSGAVSQAEFDSAQSERLVSVQAIEIASFDAEVARFELKLAKAALDQFSDDPQIQNVDPFEIYSPISGRVLRVMEESSTAVSVGTPLIEVGDPSNLEMEIDVLSTDAVKIQTGAEVTIEHWGGESQLQAHVRVVEPGAFTKISSLGVEEQRVNVIADFNEPPERIRSLGDGYRVEARITVKELKEALLIPNSTLFRYQHRWHVLAISQGQAELRSVDIGLQNESLTQVLSGLVEGEQIIQYPSDQLQPGTTVRVLP